jgi:hypothetical protein
MHECGLMNDWVRYIRYLTLYNEQTEKRTNIEKYDAEKVAQLIK